MVTTCVQTATTRTARTFCGELSALYISEGVQQACDDVSGAILGPMLVAEARALEMKFFNDMRVYDRVSRSEMLARRCKIIKNNVD